MGSILRMSRIFSASNEENIAVFSAVGTMSELLPISLTHQARRAEEITQMTRLLLSGPRQRVVCRLAAPCSSRLRQGGRDRSDAASPQPPRRQPRSPGGPTASLHRATSSACAANDEPWPDRQRPSRPTRPPSSRSERIADQLQTRPSAQSLTVDKLRLRACAFTRGALAMEGPPEKQ